MLGPPAIPHHSVPDCSTLGEAEFLREFKAGNEAALQTLLRRHWVALHQYVFGFVSCQDQAEDIVQEAFVRLWTHRESWQQEDASLRPILYQMTRNLALNERRRRSNFRKWVRKSRRSERDPRPTPLVEMQRSELKEAVRKAVDALPERRREVFVLVRTHRLTYRQAGRVMGIAPQSVANHLTRAMEDLRVALEPHLENAEPEEIPFPWRGAG